MKLPHVLAASLAALASLSAPARAETETALVAGGCFWCVESDFEKVAGVLDAISGYSGGDIQSPTYDNHEGHFEVVLITFDNAVIPYDALIAKFLRSIDVTDAGGQFCDRGSAYKSAIFVSNKAQKASADLAVAEGEAALGQNIVTPVLSAKRFWSAEEYHQDYFARNPYQPYCQFVVAPKVAKARKKFFEKLRVSA